MPFRVIVRIDGTADIGCKTRKLTEWLAIGFNNQHEVDANDFQLMQIVLRPIFELYQQRFEASQKAKETEPVAP